MRTSLLLAFLAGILSFQAAPQAHACSCAMPRSTQESIDQTDVIFSGTVDDVRASGEWRFAVSMTVDEDWKGLTASERGELTVYTATDSAACGYAFEEGEEYLVYGYRDEETGDVQVGLCSATKPLDQAEEDLALLSGDEPRACTMDAKMCPDGSYVGRDPENNCAWRRCPGEGGQDPSLRPVDICTDEETQAGAADCVPPYALNGVCAPYVCADGTTHPSCSEDGHVINYFAAPCLTHGGEAGAPFKDVGSTHANADAIFYVKSEGLVEGYVDGTFKPDATINRAEFVKILMGSFEDDGRMCKIAPFADVDQTAWYATYAHRARCQGIVEGYPDGTFKPAASINFAEAAKILVKAYGLEASMTIPACESSAPIDCPWYRSYVLMLEMKAAIPPTITRFDQKVTRGEMAEMIYRLKTNNNDKPSTTYGELAGAPVYVLLSTAPYAWNYEPNLILEYSVTAPRDRSVRLDGQSFAVDGGRWSSPTLQVATRASFGDSDTWESDDDWTDSAEARFDAAFDVPAGRTTYFRLSMFVGTPADAAVVTVKHPMLPTVIVPVKYEE